MLSILFHARTDWLYYFTRNPTLFESKEYLIRQTPSGTGVYVLNCLFRSITSTIDDGGALCCLNSVTYLLVESSSFFSCNTSSYSGGAIYFSNTGSGECVLYKLCGYDCCSTYTDGGSQGQFAYIRVKDAASSKNYIDYSSISRCVNERPYSHYTLILEYGKICCPSVNISMNKCCFRTGICCNPTIDSNFVTCSFTYSSFADNYALAYTCFYFGSGKEYEVKSCNIIRNTQVSLYSDGIIATCGNLMIKNSCILGNNANYTFYTYYSCTIILSNCTVDKTSNNGYLTIKSTVTKDFILALTHMSTQNCHSEYDSFGTLTPSNKRNHYCTCNVVFYHYQLRDFVLLMCVFVFNFSFIRF